LQIEEYVHAAILFLQQFISHENNYDFEANTSNARASSIGQERQFDSQSAVKQAVPLVKRSPLPILSILNSKLEIISHLSTVYFVYYKL